MSHPQQPSPKLARRVLYVEDEKALTDSFEEFIAQEADGFSERWRIDLAIARCIEDANRILSHENFDGLILDLMLPRQRASLSQLEAWNRQRRQLVRKFFDLTDRQTGQSRTEQAKIETLEHDKADVRAQIEVLDSQIKDLIVVEGGCEIAAEFARRREPEAEHPVLRIPVVFFTARGLPKAKQNCEAIVEQRYLRILEKPLPEEDVLRALIALFDASGKLP